jgi:hypothetical protein
MAEDEDQQSDYSEDFENTSLGDYNFGDEDSSNLDLNDEEFDAQPQIESFPESIEHEKEDANQQAGLEPNTLSKLKDELDEFDSIVAESCCVGSPGPGIDSKEWKSQVTEYDRILQKCIANENKRLAESSFITSTIAKNSRHSRAIIEKQLRIAVNQINSYRKENEFITKKLDTSIVHQELERQKQTIHEQDMKIRQLMDENRALQAVRRGHEKQLLVVEREKELQPEKDKSLHRDQRFLEKKMKSLKNQVVNLQIRDRVQYQENRDLKQKNLKLKVRVQALEMSDSVALSVKKQRSNSLVGGIGEDGMSMEVPSVHMIGDESKAGDSLVAKGSASEHDRVLSENARLKSIVSNQRSSFRQQLTTLQSRLEKSLQRRKDLETELERREKEMKVQVSLPSSAFPVTRFKAHIFLL